MEDLKTLIEKLENEEFVEINECKESNCIYRIKIVQKSRKIFWKIIIPNLPIGYKVIPQYSISDNFNVFLIHKNEIEKNQEDLFLKHLNSLDFFISRRLIYGFPKIKEFFENNLQNIKDEILEKNYFKCEYSNSINIEYIQILCGIESKLKYLFANSGFNKFLNETLEQLESKSKDLENKENELFQRAKALDLLKKHLDEILILK